MQRQEWPLAVLLDFLYGVILLFGLPYFLYRILYLGKNTRGTLQRMGFYPVRNSPSRCIWIHGVSVGEIRSARAFVGLLARSRPDWQIVLSTTTPTGQAQAAEVFPEFPRIYFPFDFSWSVASALDRIRPDCVVLLEGEIWPNFIGLCAQRGIPVINANGRISARSFAGYMRARALFSRLMKRFSMMLVQNDTYRQRYSRLGVDDDRIHVVGNIKYDNLAETPDAAAVEKLRSTLALSNGAPVWIAGSTHSPEEEMLSKVHLALMGRFPRLRFLIAPRHPERTREVVTRLKQLGLDAVDFTSVERGEPAQGKVVVLDRIGVLTTWYSVADLVFLGGSLIAHGGQNLMEPASLGKVPIIGPHHFNFEVEVARLARRGGCIVVEDIADLERRIAALLEDPRRMKATGNRAQEGVRSGRGASAEVVRALERLISRIGTEHVHTGA